MIKIPNWCTNELRIEANGSADKLEHFMEVVEDKDSALSLERLYPTPSNSDESGSIFPDWYNWRIANWGTKWDVEATFETFEVDGELLEAVYHFDSAWSPPSSAVAKMAADYPDLTFRLEYDEGGCDFWGMEYYENGELIHQEFGPSRANDEPDEYEDDEGLLILLGSGEEDLPD